MVAALQRLVREKGWTQAELAHHLDVTQGYVSRLLRGIHLPRPDLAERIGRLLSTTDASSSSTELLERLAEAIERSPEFRALMEAALRIANNHE